MFTATSTKKDFRNGVLQITVDFTDGTETITQAFNVVSEDDFNNRVQSRVNELNSLKTFASELQLGVWQAPVKQEPVADPVQEALNNVYQAKEKLGLKLITQEEFDAVVLTYKTLVGSK